MPDSNWIVDNENEQMVDDSGNHIFMGDESPDSSPPPLESNNNHHGLHRKNISNEYQTLVNHDACVSSAFPTTNYGTSTVLGVRETSGPNYVYVYIKATGLANFTSGHILDQGFLNLKRIFEAGFGIEPITRIEVRRVVGAWDESTITWNTKAAEGAENFIIELRELTTADGWAIIDIKDWLQNWIDGVWTNNGLVLKALYTDPIKKFHSSEAANSLDHPYFSLFYWPY